MFFKRKWDREWGGERGISPLESDVSYVLPSSKALKCEDIPLQYVEPWAKHKWLGISAQIKNIDNMWPFFAYP